MQAILARRPTLIAAAVLGLLAMIGAAASGSTFTGNGKDGASMAMALLAAVGLLCYGASLFQLPRPATGAVTADSASPLISHESGTFLKTPGGVPRCSQSCPAWPGSGHNIRWQEAVR